MHMSTCVSTVFVFLYIKLKSFESQIPLTLISELEYFSLLFIIQLYSTQFCIHYVIDGYNQLG